VVRGAVGIPAGGGLAQPVLCRGVEVRTAARPGARRRHSHHVHPQRRVLPELVAQQLADLGGGHRLAGHPLPQPAGGRGQRTRAAGRFARAQHPAPARLADGDGERPPIRRGDEVDGDPQERALRDAAPLERPIQLIPLEALEPRPQPHVHRRRVLRLDPAHALERLRNARAAALEQQLAREQRPVELALGEDAGRHRAAARPARSARSGAP
jgi:hypothetical protein